MIVKSKLHDVFDDNYEETEEDKEARFIARQKLNKARDPNDDNEDHNIFAKITDNKKKKGMILFYFQVCRFTDK